MQSHTPKDNMHRIAIAGAIIAAGLFFLKFLPMLAWGPDILFDASAHIAIALFVLYIGWFFIDQSHSLRVPFLLFVFLVLAIISLQRILVSAHNDVGLLLGLVLGVGAIGISQWDKVRKKIDF
ncbi:MAG: hypothetical protein HGB03_03250 [Candidatus Yonathbacteria bacterium]|nr:hypothetical protein [Candidatus Yonathbacteria bacterium]NTW47353.1 hypothetical protein [Candidatus Yonathbacteria bacterium]